MNDPAAIQAATRMLDLAARHAWRGFGDVEPNPMVGAVLARETSAGPKIIAIGHHRRFGGPHAEREAIDAARAAGHADLRGSTLYVTLEPCAHHGKQPPCIDAILNAGVSRVVVGCADPNPVAAGGAEILRRAGVHVDFVQSPGAVVVTAPFLKRVRTGLPWVVAKWAQTVDGRVATRTGESKWISGELARARVHRLRSRVDAIITGIGTVLADDPMLTARHVPRIRRVARRVICDTDLDLPVNFSVVRSANSSPTTVVCAAELAVAEITAHKRAVLNASGVDVLGVKASAVGVDLEAMLRALAERYTAATVMVEAGPAILGSFLDHDLIDEAVVYVAPLMLGDELAKSAAAGRIAPTLAMGRRLDLLRVRALGNDVELVYRRPDRSR
jgi:diaminohydroxyphosphoribosylaminopyrimidine deaminase/5-amino-6-(5-phosphoribosylamino)uracil reductase